MKKFILVLMMLCTNAFGAITDLKLSTAQIFDVQWNISGGKLNVSGFNYIYASINYSTQTASAARWTSTQTSDANSNGRYIGFFNSTTNPGTYGMAVFNSDGTKYKIINNTGSFRALANGAIFYNGNGMWGTLITTGQGYALGSSAQFTVTQENPTNTQLEAYVPPSSTPLAAGETAQPQGGGSQAPTYTSDITTIQTTTMTNARSRISSMTSGNKVYLEEKSGTSNSVITIEQTGSYNVVQGIGGGNAVVSGTSNTVTVKQGDTLGRNIAEFSVEGNSNSVTVWQSRSVVTGLADSSESGGHYLALGLTGNSNTVVVKQGNDGGAWSGHIGVVSITGGNNSLTLTQSGNNDKRFFGVVTGSNTGSSVSQTGTGNHYFDLALSGNGHQVAVTQKDAGSHRATVSLTNAGGASNLQLVQQGSTAGVYNITQQCATLSGCSVSVTQGQ